MRKHDIEEYGSLDPHTLYVVSKWIDNNKPETVRKKISEAMNVTGYLLERHYEENINGKS